MPSIPLKKIILLFFMSLFFSSSSFAGIENWADTSVCLWLKSSGGGNPVPLAEAKKRGISCKDGKVIKSQQKSSKIQTTSQRVKTTLCARASFSTRRHRGKVSSSISRSNNLVEHLTATQPMRSFSRRSTLRTSRSSETLARANNSI